MKKDSAHFGLITVIFFPGPPIFAAPVFQTEDRLFIKNIEECPLVRFAH